MVGFGAVQMILLGVIGEYLGRIYAETKHRPHFLIRESSDGQAAVTVQLGPERGQQPLPPAEPHPAPREAGE